jgi:Na+-driven multidrug efflux pump
MSEMVSTVSESVVSMLYNFQLLRLAGSDGVAAFGVMEYVTFIFFAIFAGYNMGVQPLFSFNFGAKQFDRVRKSINFTTLSALAYTVAAWLLVFFLPRVWIGIFTDDAAMITAGTDMLRIYFFGFICMALQFSGQTAFTSLGDARHAITFSLLRKVIIVVPLTFLLPLAGFGVKGVFLAEPVSNVIGGLACFITMRLTVMKKMKQYE